ncbi:MAG: hypothetical protein IPH72_18310 [Sandaracinaceae bacterium]|nr:hypothetical protein [Sandaracinaceae bacterium]
MRSLLLLVTALLLALTWQQPLALAQEHSHAEAPSDAIFAGVSDLSTLPPNPPDYMSESVGNVTWDFPRQAESDARELIAAWRPAWDGIEADLGEALDSTMRIRIARNATEMRALAPVGSPPPEYAAGVAYPSLGLVLLTFTAPQGVEPPDIQKVMVHELSHVALHRAVRGNPVPRWFTEGLAIHQAGELSFERAKVLMRATYSSERIPLRELSERFPSRAYDVDLAYAQSADIVRFLLADPRGAAKLRRLVRGVRDGASFADALEDAYYMRPAQLEREWIADLSSRNRLFPVLVGGGIAWTLAALLLPLAYLRRRRRARAKLADMAKRETEERAERLRELLETLRARQSLWVVAPGDLTATPLAVGRSPADSADTAADADETTGGTAASQSRGIARSDGGLPVVRIGDETHTLH